MSTAAMLFAVFLNGGYSVRINKMCMIRYDAAKIRLAEFQHRQTLMPVAFG
jgi:hypothetical protein